jgi:hypothetical protein
MPSPHLRHSFSRSILQASSFVGILLGLSALAPTAEAQTLRTGRALLVGADTYGLQFSGKDAALMAKTLRASGAVFSESKIRVLDDLNDKNNAPTRANILRALNWLCESTSDEIITLYFSGHGALDAAGNQYLIVADTDRNNLEATGLPVAEVRAILGSPQMRAKGIVVIFDSCHSGVTQKSAPLARGPKLVPAGSLLEGSAIGREQITLSSCDVNEESWEDSAQEHSVYTANLAQGLRGDADSNGDGLVTATELHLYASPKTRRFVTERGLVQTPRIFFSGSEDVVMAKVAARTTTQTPSSIQFKLSNPLWREESNGRLIIDSRPGAKLNISGNVESPNGIVRVTLDGVPLAWGSLGAKGLDLMGRTRMTDTDVIPTAGNRSEYLPASIFSFKSPFQAPDGETTKILIAEDKTGQKGRLELVFRPSALLKPTATRANLAVLGLSSSESDRYPLLRRLGVGGDLQQAMTQVLRADNRFGFVMTQSQYTGRIARDRAAKPDAAFDQEDAITAGQMLDLPWVVYGSLYRFSLPSENGGVLKAKVQINLVNVRTYQLFPGFGEGRLTVPKPWKKDNEVTDDQIGQVTREAIASALNDLWTYTTARGVEFAAIAAQPTETLAQNQIQFASESAATLKIQPRDRVRRLAQRKPI